MGQFNAFLIDLPHNPRQTFRYLLPGLPVSYLKRMAAALVPEFRATILTARGFNNPKLVLIRHFPCQTLQQQSFNITD
jgi:hypothetical protein